jgi:enoyl-CoA hydratase/carnithine racemase
MGKDDITLRKEGALARIILNNPARLNAISMAMWDSIDRVLDDLADDNATRVVIISGAGGKAFSAGADISEFDRRHADPAAVRNTSARDAGVCAKLENLEEPTIAEIEEGYCLGGASPSHFAAICALSARRTSLTHSNQDLGVRYS